MPYTITNTGYPGQCAANLTIPVIEEADAALAVQLGFRPQLQIGTPFSFTLDEAIQCADRHIYVHGRPPNPLPFVQDWINLLRWEVSNLWRVDAAQSRFARDCDTMPPTRSLTAEHYKRSGEILAEGVATLFLERRLHVARQRFFFFEGADARPDFIVSLKARHRRALLLNRRRFMFEVRSRNADEGMRNLAQRDKDDLEKKKVQARHLNGVAGVLAIYNCYGMKAHRDGTSQTRIHLADPAEFDAPDADDIDVASIAIHHFILMTSQVGLWDHRDHLQRAVTSFTEGRIPRETMVLRGIERGIERPFLGRSYRGRDFNSLIEFAFKTPRSLSERDQNRRTVRAQVAAGDFGLYTFRGLDTQVLSLIENSQWSELADFAQESQPGYKPEEWLRSDGLYCHQFQIQAGTTEADEVRSQLQTIIQ